MKSHSQNEKNVMQVTIIHNTNIISNNYHVWKQQLHNNCETLAVQHPLSSSIINGLWKFMYSVIATEDGNNRLQ